jgi:hypothetical protein
MKTILLSIALFFSSLTYAQDYSIIKIYQKINDQDSLIRTYHAQIFISVDTCKNELTVCENGQITVEGFRLKRIQSNRFQFEKKTHFLMTPFTQECEIMKDQFILYTHCNLRNQFKYKIIFTH